MLSLVVLLVLGADVLKPPKQPGFVLTQMCRVTDLLNANEMKIHPEYYKDSMPHWVRLYGVDLPTADKRGYSGAREDLELLLGREPDVYVEDENPDHVITRNAYYVQYVWAYGKLIEFELVRDGWAKVNDEGRKGKYAKPMLAAQAEAQRLKEGLWGLQ